jgi:hypothetical protein
MFGITIERGSIYDLPVTLTYGSFWGQWSSTHVLTPQQGRFQLPISNTAHLQGNQEVKTAVGIEHARKGYT